MQPPSLLDHLDAAILVGDPDGRVVYVNPAFESDFGVTAGTVRGQPLALLFQGGARELILRAMADACGGGGHAHFHVREGDQGYMAVASPISAEASRVGVIIMLTRDQVPSDRLHACGRGFAASIDELTHCLEDLRDLTDSSTSLQHRAVLDDAQKSTEALRKQSEELLELLAR